MAPLDLIDAWPARHAAALREAAERLRALLRQELDHLAVAPHMILPTWPLALVVNYFMMWFLLWLKATPAEMADIRIALPKRRA